MNRISGWFKSERPQTQSDPECASDMLEILDVNLDSQTSPPASLLSRTITRIAGKHSNEPNQEFSGKLGLDKSISNEHLSTLQEINLDFPVHSAISFDCEEYTKAAEAAIHAGFDVNSVNENGETLLHLLIDHLHHGLPPEKVAQRASLIQLVIEKGGDVHQADSKGNTPFRAIASFLNYGNQQLVIDALKTPRPAQGILRFYDSYRKLMEKYGLTVRPSNKVLEILWHMDRGLAVSPVTYLANHINKETGGETNVIILLELVLAGLDVTKTYHEGKKTQTLLHYITKAPADGLAKQKADVEKLLIAIGLNEGDVWALNSDFKTPVENAISSWKSDPALLEFLLGGVLGSAYDQKVRETAPKVQDGTETMLHRAANEGNVSAVHKLLIHGFSNSYSDKEMDVLGHTLAGKGSREDKLEILHFLLNPPNFAKYCSSEPFKVIVDPVHFDYTDDQEMRDLLDQARNPQLAVRSPERL